MGIRRCMTPAVFSTTMGSYDVMSKAAKHLLQMYPIAGAKVTLAPENLPYLTGAIRHLYSLRAPQHPGQLRV